MEKDSKTALQEANTHKQRLKLLQVVQNFFTKALQVIVLSRSITESKNQNTSASKINKWFNLYMASLDDDHVRHELRPWKLHVDLALFPPMIIETSLDLSQLSAHEYVVLEDDTKSVWPVSEGEQKEIVLERWLIKFDCSSSVSSDTSAADELPLMYKQAIILLRTIYLLVRLLPLFKLRKLASKPSSNLLLVNHFLDGSQPVTSKNRIGLSKSIIPLHLLGESHLTQRDFTPIETSLGTLSVSVVYRNHFKFRAQDQEERLLRQFVTSDKEEADAAADSGDGADATEVGPFQRRPPVSSALSQRVVVPPPTQRTDGKTPFRGSFEQFRERFSVLPCTSDHLDRFQMLPPRGSNNSKLVVLGRPTIQPFRVGSIGSGSPPHHGGHSPAPSGTHASLSERRVSITSNRLGLNASLIALLRNPRGSSSTPAGNVAITGAQSNTVSLPRSITSSHGSHLIGQDDPQAGVSGIGGGGESAGTPKFLSSFGSRQSRRFSSHSARAAGQHSEAANSYMGTSLDSGLSCAPSSGLYVDDDIGSFVRMIDGKSELRLSISTNNSESRLTPPSTEYNTHTDALNRFHLLKSQYQQLGDSVNASLVLQKQHSSRDNQSMDSRLTGSRMGNSGNLTNSANLGNIGNFDDSGHSRGLFITSTVPPSSYDMAHMPSISSRLLGASDADFEVDSQRNSPRILAPRSGRSQRSPSRSSSSPPSRQSALSGTGALGALALGHFTQIGVEGLGPLGTLGPLGALGPLGSRSLESQPQQPYSVSHQSSRKPKEVHYHDVFEDDDEGTDFYRTRQKHCEAHELEFDNDDLLFEMTDTK